ncbi:MAG: pilus assembly protein PilM [Planctomycetota bacterium]|nr:pilus assembly protein PilM [Planctomycetota bacterium]
MARTSTGIDIGASSAIALCGQYKGNTFHVTDFNARGNPSLGSSAAEGDSSWLLSGWEELAQGFKPVAARVGLTGRDVNVRYTRVPRVPDWQLRNLMRFEVSEIGDQSGTEVPSDINLLPELPEVEGEDVVLLAMAREGLLDDHLEGLDLTGGNLDSFSPSAIALYNAWTHFGVVEDETVLLANIGHDNIDVVIARGPDLLFARNLSGGSRLFDQALAQRFNVGPAQAEKLKLKYASLRSGAAHPTPNHEKASRAIMGAAGQILSLLQSAILFCKSQVKISGLKVDRVMLCGGGAALDGLPQYISGGMGVTVELFDAFRMVETDKLDAASADLLEEFKLEAVVALGLATMGSDSGAYSLEILPASLAKKRAFWGETIWLIAAALLAVCYLGFKTVHLADELDRVNSENAGLQSRLSRETRIHREAEQLIEENESLRVLASQLQWVAGLGEQGARAMSQLDNSLPGDFWVSELTSEWTFDPELGVERNSERPMLMVRGMIRPGTDSPSRQFQEMTRALREALVGDGKSGGRMKESIDRDQFSLDLCLFGPPPPAADDGEGDAEGEEY